MDIKKILSGRVVGLVPSDIFFLWSFMHMFLDQLGPENVVKKNKLIWDSLLQCVFHLDNFVDSHTLDDPEKLKNGYSEYTVYLENVD